MKKIFYGMAVYDSKEINACMNVLRKSSLTLMDGPKVKALEKKVSSIFGKKYGLMVNSGSSANLLALSSINLKKNDEIITPALTFSTTVSPIIQLGFIPKFIDVDSNKFVINPDQIENNISKRTKALMIPNLLGNLANWPKIKKIAKKYKLKIIEDSADTIGYSINNLTTGKLSDIVTTSFYASHVVTGAGFGGMVCFNDYDTFNKAKLLRGWGRSSAILGEREDIKSRFNIKLSGIDYDQKYIFSDFGYNFLPSEISAAFALEQIKKLKKNILRRISNFNKLKKFFLNYKNYFDIPESYDRVKTGWLAFPIVIKKNIKFKRKSLQIFLEKNNIQTRTIFTGNILRQPLLKKINYKKNKEGYDVSDHVMKNGILIGCNHGMQNYQLNYMKKKFIEFLKKNENNKDSI
jgi:CDP-6-deoxy-D-xylo-4-hexulose-3-dehydrase